MSTSISKIITFDYDNANVYNLQTYNQLTGSYSPINSPNLIYNDGSTEYICNAKKIYIVNKYHKIDDIKYDGELIIQHSPTSIKGTSIYDIYTCFLLQNTNYTTNDLDNIINGSPDVTSYKLNLNKLIPEKDYCVSYESGNSIVIIFTTPLKINHMPEDMSKFDTASLFTNIEKSTKLLELPAVNLNLTKQGSSYSDLDKAVSNISSSTLPLGSSISNGSGSLSISTSGLVENISPVTESFSLFSIREGFNEADVKKTINKTIGNMECEMIPYDMSGNSETVKSYLIDSTFMSDKASNDAMVMIKYFIIFLFFGFFTYQFIPMIYLTLASLALDRSGTETTSSIYALNVRGMEISFNVLVGIIVLIILVTSAAKKNQDTAIGGFMFAIIWVISYTVIEYKKTDPEFLHPVLKSPFNEAMRAVFKGKIGLYESTIGPYINIISNLGKEVNKLKSRA